MQAADPDPCLGIDSELARLDKLRSSLLSIREDITLDPEKYRGVIECAADCWGLAEDSMWEWLCRPNMRLETRSPIQATFEGDGEKVANLIIAITHGVYL